MSDHNSDKLSAALEQIAADPEDAKQDPRHRFISSNTGGQHSVGHAIHGVLVDRRHASSDPRRRRAVDVALALVSVPLKWPVGARCLTIGLWS